MKRNIRAFWLEVDLSGLVVATVMRDRIGAKPNVYSYQPTKSSLTRINNTAKILAQDSFSPYESNPVNNANVLVGWVLWRLPSAVYPPPMGTRTAGQKASFVPTSKAISS